MQGWAGVLSGAVATLGVLATGSALARWASGVDVRLPLAATACTAAACGFVAGARLGLEPALPAFVLLAVGAAVLVGIDLRLHRLPDRLTGATAASGLLLLAAAAAVDGTWSTYARALLGGAGLLTIYVVLFLAARSGLGAGDVKLAAVLGLHLAWFGWPTLVVGGFAGFLAGGLASLALLTARRATLATRLPFGPSMVAGAVLAVALGPDTAGVLLGG